MLGIAGRLHRGAISPATSDEEERRSTEMHLRNCTTCYSRLLVYEIATEIVAQEDGIDDAGVRTWGDPMKRPWNVASRIAGG